LVSAITQERLPLTIGKRGMCAPALCAFALGMNQDRVWYLLPRPMNRVRELVSARQSAKPADVQIRPTFFAVRPIAVWRAHFVFFTPPCRLIAFRATLYFLAHFVGLTFSPIRR